MDALLQSQSVERTWIQKAFGAWSVFVVLVATVASFTIPMHLLFGAPSETFFVFREIILAGVFGLDVIISLKRIKTQHSAQLFELNILRSFYKKWLIPDALAAIPFALFLANPFFEFLHLLKLIKVIYLAYMLSRIYIRFNNAIVLMQFVYWLSLLSHWLSCGWLYIRGIVETATVSDYISALYWTVATLTTVGYGDITPESDLERIYAVVTMILGYSLIGYLIGSIAGILTKKNPSQEKYQQNLELLANAVQHAQLPLDLQRRLHAYYIYQFERGVGYDESSFVEGLPPGLKAEVSLYFRQEAIESISIFQDATDEFILEIAQHLTERIVPAGDFIFKAGELGHEMYFIARGEVGIYNASTNKLIHTLKEGDFFGEISLFEDIPRTASVRAETYCDLYTLHKRTFDQIFANFPSIRSQIKEKAEKRQEIQ